MSDNRVPQNPMDEHQVQKKMTVAGRQVRTPQSVDIYWIGLQRNTWVKHGKTMVFPINEWLSYVFLKMFA